MWLFDVNGKLHNMNKFQTYSGYTYRFFTFFTNVASTCYTISVTTPRMLLKLHFFRIVTYTV